MRILIVGILFILYMLFRCPMWLAEDSSYLLRAITYSFFHANIFHLAVNCLSAWLVFQPTNKNNGSRLFFGLVIAFLVYPLSSSSIVGFSNVLFGIAGMSAQPFSDHYYWSRKEVWIAISVMLLMLLFPHFSAVTHIASYILGILFMYIRFYAIDPIKRDARRFIKD